MKITKITIENFRTFENLDLDFQGYVAFVGENGTGKTAILEAINYCLSPYFLSGKIKYSDFYNGTNSPINIQIFFDEEFKAFLQDGYQEREMNCKGVFLEVKRRNQAAAQKAFSGSFVVRHFVIPADTVLSEEEGKWYILRNNGNKFEFTERHLSFPLKTEGLPKSFYFNKNRERQIYKGYNSSISSIFDDFNWRFIKKIETDENLKNTFNKQLVAFEKTIKENIDQKTANKTFGSINKKLKDDFNLCDISLSFVDPLNPFDKAFISQNSEGCLIESSNFGSGIEIIVAFILLETLANLSKENIILLIDEPELHLHAQLQQKLFDYVKKSDAQFIYSTHSDLMVGLDDWKNIFRIFNKNRFPTEELLNTQVDGKAAKEHLNDMVNYYQNFTIFFRENNEIFFAKKVVLTEGPAEKTCIPVILDKFGETLKNKEISFISANGKDKLKYYQLICKVFGVLYFTVFDLDNKTETDDENKIIIDNSNNSDYFHFQSSFENVLGIGSNTDHKATKTIKKVIETKKENFDQMIKNLVEKLKTF